MGQQGRTLESLWVQENWENRMVNMKIMDPKGTNYTKCLPIAT